MSENAEVGNAGEVADTGNTGMEAVAASSSTTSWQEAYQSMRTEIAQEFYQVRERPGMLEREANNQAHRIAAVEESASWSRQALQTHQGTPDTAHVRSACVLTSLAKT